MGYAKEKKTRINVAELAYTLRGTLAPSKAEEDLSR